MRLEQLKLNLRRRSGWESIDLGLTLCHAWRGPVLRIWLATYGLFALLISLLLWQHPDWAILIIWWLKPLFDRVLLFVFSRCVFNHIPSVSEVWRELPALIKHTRLLAGLTFYRLSPSRSFFLPVWQLEGQRGTAARQRRQVLGLRTTGYAWGLMFFCSNFAMVLWISSLLLCLMFIPREAIPEDWSWWQFVFGEQEHLWLGHFSNVLILLADTLIEPLFVASGFSLYLNRRSELEGWDIEVAFRRMAERVETSRQRLATHITTSATLHNLLLIALCALCSLGSLLFTPQSSHAQGNSDSLSAPQTTLETAPAALDASNPSITEIPAIPAAVEFSYAQPELKQRLKEVMEDPVFGKTEQEWTWRYREAPDPKKPQPGRWDDFFKSLRSFFAMIAEGSRILVWVIIALALMVAIYLVLRYQHYLPWQRTQRVIPEQMFGLDVRPESLPDDIGAAALQLLEANQIIAALGLLYRGTLSALIHHAAVDFEPGDTEENCWQRARPVLPPSALDYFRQLLDAWLWTVYAHRPPLLPTLRALCLQWNRHFTATALHTSKQQTNTGNA